MATVRATALPTQAGATMRKPMLDVSTTEVSATSSASTTPSDSPAATPRHSPSNSSLTSMDSNEVLEKPTASTTNPRLVDAYGNEFVIPDYTIKQIRDAIPAHCFERSALTGASYIARDVVALASIFLVFHNFVTPQTVPNYALRTALWTLYTVLQGFFGTGLWVIAHECGHQSFSPSKAINDSVGWVLHSALLVPYFSWKISHGKHHKATGNLERDMVFVPPTREIYSSKVGKLVHQLDELTEDTPIASLIHIVVQQLGGWPAYLLSNVTGHDYHEKQSEGKGVGKKNGWFSGVNHFNPSSPLYERKDEKLILLSDLGIAITATVLYLLTSKFGFANMFTWYFAPYLWVNNWLVAITFLQHTDPSLPHYTAESWTYTRGAAATIDRDFWPIGPYCFHDIIETHVLHHYISVIPFYHAREATEAIKPVMGRHYRIDTKGGGLGFLRSLWVNSRSCQWVEPNEGATGENKGVMFFSNRNKQNQLPGKMTADITQ